MNADREHDVSRDGSEATFAIIALAASAGGLQAVRRVLAALPLDFPVPIVLVQHLERQRPTVLATVLSRDTPLRVKLAEDGETCVPGRVYIAPPDYHLLVNSDGTLSLSQAGLVHYVRPSADRLFGSVAQSYRERAIAVVLSGMGLDGATGVQAIKNAGGIVIAQNEATSQFFGMPEAAINTGSVDQILPLDAIAPTLLKLVHREGSS
ncbi:MAG TPA: chemotaxis protein CheB [Chthonomonadaceae bacterium]|nr:chemotaxis protein CheB [Chthonomonadaceae bacterium]